MAKNRYYSTCFMLAITIAILHDCSNGFQLEKKMAPMFQSTAPSWKKLAPSKKSGIEIELPNFDELFRRIQQVSPLSRQAIHQTTTKNGYSPGFQAIIDDNNDDNLSWKTIEDNPKRAAAHKIEKIDNFQNLNCPLLRFRSSIQGPCHGQAFAEFIMNIHQRTKWDPSIKQVYERYPIRDLDLANIIMGFGQYGDCRRLGVGYCRTKSYLNMAGREQLTLCGIQDFSSTTMPSTSTIIWGTEMQSIHNHLLPSEERRITRAKTHLLSATLVPTSIQSFDLEYCIQLDIGGGIPNWISTPIVVETIKSLFQHTQDYFTSDQVYQYIDQDNKERTNLLEQKHSILMTP